MNTYFTVNTHFTADLADTVSGLDLGLADEVVERTVQALLSLCGHPAVACEMPIVRALVQLNALEPDKAILRRAVR